MSVKKPEIGVMAIVEQHANPFPWIAKLGIKTAQVTDWLMEELTPENAAAVKRQMAENGVSIAAYWAGYTGEIIWDNYDGPLTCGIVPRDQRERRVKELKLGADFAKMLNAPAIITHCGFIPETPRDPLYKETVDAISEVAGYCHDLGLGFWFESGQETPVTLLRTIEDIGLPNLGVNLDTANLILYGRGNPVDALDVIGPYVRNLHVKDGLFPSGGRSLGKEVPFGQGKANFPEIVRKLRALEFSGVFAIEREITGEQQIRDIKAAKEELERLIEYYY
ncbi:MAG: sugar phosphate isomerase/epimerase [Lentisphaerae bacterium]|nr:sugar phosphate isomerase/epimerase [Lentisphaerota bacterium]